MLERQIPGLCPRHAKSESLGVRSSSLFSQALQMTAIQVQEALL